MKDTLNKYHEFENLCAELIKKLGYKISRYNIQLTNSLDYEPDLIISKGNTEIVVEIKLYKTRKANYGSLKQAIMKLKSFGIEKQLLIVASLIDDEIKTQLEKKFGLKIYDSRNILFLLKDFDELYIKYRAIMSDIPSDVYEPEEIVETNLEELFSQSSKEVSHKNMKKHVFLQKGKELSEELKLLGMGKEFYAKYEKLCIKILKYIFEENLNGWHEQLRTEDELNRYDLVCRVKIGNEFWNFLINEFDSRYIIFEFKNYSEEIKQTQIYTTEKYLFKTALRNVSFIISRKGATNNALKASKGILREVGKLIINLKDEDLFEMVKLKDEGSEPSDYLFEIVDKYLLELEK